MREIIASAQLKRFSPRKSQIKKEIVITSAEFQRKREKISCQDLMLCTFLLCRTLLPPTGLSLSTWTSMKPRQAATIDRDGRTNMRCMFCQYTDAVLVETHQFDTFTSFSSTLHYCTQPKKSTLSWPQFSRRHLTGCQNIIHVSMIWHDSLIWSMFSHKRSLISSYKNTGGTAQPSGADEWRRGVIITLNHLINKLVPYKVSMT